MCFVFENVLLRDNPCISPQECDEVVFENYFESVCEEVFVVLSKYLRFFTYSKKTIRSRFL